MNTTHVVKFLAKGPPKRPKAVQVPAGEELERCFQQAGLGTRLLVFVSGEPGASFRHSSERALVFATRVSPTLPLTQEGTDAIQQMLNGLSSLKGKVEALADQILRWLRLGSEIKRRKPLIRSILF